MKLLNKAFLYFNTVKYLRCKQIFYRLYYRFFNPTVKLKVDDISACSPASTWLKPIAKDHEYFIGDEVRFLNIKNKHQSCDIWNKKEVDKLWLYNLHYFDALNSYDPHQQEHAANLLERWVDENPPFLGNGWEPYPISLRIVNIIKYKLAGHALSDKIIQSIYLQARYLRKHCEFHLLANHLFENVKALCFAGLFFKSKEAKSWLAFALKQLEREVKEQILDDGGHFELSPMYHGIILEGLLDLNNLFQAFQQLFPWQQKIKKMIVWLQYMMRPNDEYSYFNDAAQGVAAKPSEILAYAKHLGFQTDIQLRQHCYLKASGYFVYINDRIKVIVDVGKIGPGYQPGHGHADVLSFELYVDGKPVFVNCGTSCYGNGAQRLAERSTLSHNTIEVNQQNSSEVWSGFRVARRARLLNIAIAEQDNQVILSASHDGYERIQKGLRCSRQFLLSKDQLMIIDQLSSSFDQVISHLYLHPSCDYHGDQSTISLQNTQKLHVSSDREIMVSEAKYAQEFNKLFSTQCLRWQIINNQPVYFSISLQDC